MFSDVLCRDGDRVPFKTIVIEPRFRFQKIGNRKIEYHMSNFIMSQFYIHLRCQNFVARACARARWFFRFESHRTSIERWHWLTSAMLDESNSIFVPKQSKSRSRPKTIENRLIGFRLFSLAMRRDLRLFLLDVWLNTTLIFVTCVHMWRTFFLHPLSLTHMSRSVTKI